MYKILKNISILTEKSYINFLFCIFFLIRELLEMINGDSNSIRVDREIRSI